MHHEIPEDELEEPRPLLTPFAPPQPRSAAWRVPDWNLSLAFFNWAGSLVFALLIPLLLILVYGGLVEPGLFQDLRAGQLTKPLVVLQLIGAFGAQIFSLGLSWIIVTGAGQRSFADAIGLQWAARFKLPHAIALGLGMFFLSMAVMALLPRHETDLDKLVKFGLLARLGLALVATIGAPLQEEIVYRGVLYTALEKTLGVGWGLTLVTLLFGAMHIVQYRQSVATVVAVFCLSLVLTVLRAWTGKLLPCVATHLFFNGIQGVWIVFSPEPTTTPTAEPAALLFWGLGF